MTITFDIELGVAAYLWENAAQAGLPKMFAWDAQDQEDAMKPVVWRMRKGKSVCLHHLNWGG